MANHPNDDLFEGTSMTFGEHLEELRGALFKSMIGLVIGVVIGFMVADKVVEFIKVPLETALKNYYEKHELEKAEKALGVKFPPEMRVMLTEEGVIPAEIKVDPFQLITELKNNYPTQFGAIHFKPNQFILDDVSEENTKPLAQALQASGKSTELTAGKQIWEAFTQADQKIVRDIASADKVSTAQREALIVALNHAIENPEIHSTGPLAEGPEFKSRITGPTPYEINVMTATKSWREQLDASIDSDTSRRLNRFLVVATFSELIRKPRMNVVSLPTWKKADITVQALGVHEAFMIWVKAAIVTGIVIGSPWVFWHIWMFVASGLYPHEQKYVYVFLPFSLILFVAGASLAYFVVFGYVLDFLFGFNSMLNVDPDPRISEWLSFVLMLPIGFGVSFQLPLVMLFLQRIGIFTVESYLDKWRIAILVIAVISMLLTPADPMSMLLMASPLTALYFLGIGLCQWLPKSRSPFDEPEDP